MLSNAVRICYPGVNCCIISYPTDSDTNNMLCHVMSSVQCKLLHLFSASVLVLCLGLLSNGSSLDLQVPLAWCLLMGG